MKVLQINAVCGNCSTGKIAVDLYNVLEKEGNDCVIAYGRRGAPEGVKTIKICGKINNLFHIGISMIFDNSAFLSTWATHRLIKKIDEYDPDIIQLHSLLGYYINIEVLLKYLAKINKPVIYTMHNCWAITGHCTYFDYAKCDKWKTGCEHCPQKTTYPPSLIFDNSKKNYEKKKELFNNIKDLTLVTPSQWLADLVKQSYLKDKKVVVINNGINLEKFKPTQGDFRKKYNLENKFIILGVASVWEKRKGLESFIRLSKKLDENYQIVLVGLKKSQQKNIPQNIISIPRTESIEQLAELYTTADVFFNPTYEENFPTTNLESIACGTPIITYKTGGSVESVDKEWGYVVEQGDVDSVEKIVKQLKGKPKKTKECLESSKQYDKELKFKEYIKLYEDKMKEKQEKNENVTIYVVSHKPATFPENKIYKPIQVGTKEKFTEIRDNTEENISTKNPNFCELTAAYWIWKNDKSDITGLTHYRRYFFKNKNTNSIKDILDEKDIKNILNEYDIIVPETERIVKYSVKGAYAKFHHGEDFDKCREIIFEKYPEYLEAFDKVANGRKLYLYNMFISKKEIFNDYYKWLFDILLELENRVDITNYSDYDKRIYGFLSERLFRVWLEKNNNLKIKEMPVYNTEQKVFPQRFVRTIQKILVR